jgi:CDP-diacylglycerol--glycerol-3-phosphate 3-phosphatidyltransferase
MGASMGGKIKAFTYMIAGAVALIAASIDRLDISSTAFSVFRITAIVIFSISVVMSALSFLDYVKVYKKTGA